MSLSDVHTLLVMGVAGCGKSTLAAQLSEQLNWPWIEADDWHSPANQVQMAQGHPLSDEQRQTWINALATEIRTRPPGLILACSALRQSHRVLLRDASSSRMATLHLALSLETAKARVEARSKTHFFPASLVESQFAAFERPHHEPFTLTLNAMQSIEDLVHTTVQWLPTVSFAPSTESPT